MTVKRVILKGIPVSFIYIDTNSQHYRDAAALRYAVFFKKLNLDLDIINDSYESSSIHMAAVTDKGVIGYGRLSPYGSTARISQMAVKSKMRGMGIGSRIMNIFIETIFSILGISFIFTRLPQLYRLIQRKSSDDISLLYWYSLILLTLPWIGYSIYKNSFALTCTYILTSIINIVMIISIHKYRGKL